MFTEDNSALRAAAHESLHGVFLISYMQKPCLNPSRPWAVLHFRIDLHAQDLGDIRIETTKLVLYL